MFFLFLCVWSYLVLQCYLLLRCWMHTFFICFKHVYGFVPSLMLPYVEIEGRLCLYLAGIWLDLHRDFHDALWYGSKEINDKERCRLVINLDRSLCLCWWWYPDFSASCLQDIRTNVPLMLSHSPSFDLSKQWCYYCDRKAVWFFSTQQIPFCIIRNLSRCYSSTSHMLDALIFFPIVLSNNWIILTQLEKFTLASFLFIA